MNSLEKKIYKVASKVYRLAEKEFENLKKFYNSNTIDDYGLDCQIVFFKKLKDVIIYEEFMEKYFEEKYKSRIEQAENRRVNLNYLFDSLQTWIKSQVDTKIISEIDFAICRIRSYHQFLTDINVNNINALRNILLKVETKSLLLRDKLTETLLKELLSKKDEGFSNFNMYLKAFFLTKDEEIDLVLNPLDLKFLRNLDLTFLRYESKDREFFGGYLLRELKRLAETCRWKNLKLEKLKTLVTSIVVEKEYYICNL